MRPHLLASICSLALAATLPLSTGCEKTDHATIDKWKGTQKGEGKLKAALFNASIDADLSAHAAANLLVIGREPDVRDAFEGTKLSADRKTAIAGKLVARLWPVARVEGELAVPSAAQATAKDMLYMLRRYVAPADKATLDGYLVDWYTSGYYEGRATVGAHLGAEIMRALGAQASSAMIAAANAVVAKPPTGADGRTRIKIGDELLLGLAAVASPETVKYVLDVVGMTDRGDDTLGRRAMAALYKAFVDPGGLFDVAPPDGLTPNLAQLVAIAKEDDYPAAVANDAVTLIRMTGKPACVQPLIELVGYGQRDQRFRYVGANSALKCGGASALVQVALALPTTDAYFKDELAGAVWLETPKLSPAPDTAAALRELLGSGSWVARWIAIEGLGAIKSTADKAAILKLAGDKAKLTGYWGSQSGVDAKARKPDPTLGQRANEIAATL